MAPMDVAIEGLAVPSARVPGLVAEHEFSGERRGINVRLAEQIQRPPNPEEHDREPKRLGKRHERLRDQTLADKTPRPPANSAVANPAQRLERSGAPAPE